MKNTCTKVLSTEKDAKCHCSANDPPLHYVIPLHIMKSEVILTLCIMKSGIKLRSGEIHYQL